MERLLILIPDGKKAFPEDLEWIQDDQEWQEALANPDLKCFIQGRQRFATPWRNWALMCERQVHVLWQEVAQEKCYSGELGDELQESKEQVTLLMRDPGARALWKEHEKRLKTCNELGQLKTTHRKLEMDYIALKKDYEALKQRYEGERSS